MKKTISLILSLLLLMGMFAVQASAADVIIQPDVFNSITEEEETGLGVAFLYTMNMQDTAIAEGTNRAFKSATVTVDGVDYAVVKMGAVVTNSKDTGVDPNAMVIENVTGDKMCNVEAKKLWDWDESTCSFAVRIIEIPEIANKVQVYARPYFVYEDASGEETTVYGDIANKSYFSGWCDSQPAVELPAIGTDIDVTKMKNRIRVSEATIVDRTVSLTFRNYTTNWITEETDYVRYTCYDASGTILDADPNSTAKYGVIYIGCIDTKKNKIKTFTFDVPDATAKVALTYSKITYWTEWA